MSSKDPPADMLPSSTTSTSILQSPPPIGLPHVGTEESIPGTPPPSSPQMWVTFLLVSGRRRAMAFDAGTSVGRVKELVWNAWPAEWQDERPPTPQYLRLVHLGKILQDDEALPHLSSSPDNPTVVHLTIRASVPQMEDPALQKRGKRRNVGGAGEGDEGEGCGCSCGCVIC